MLTKTLYDYIDPIDAECVHREVKLFFTEFYPDENPSLFERAFLDVEKLFSGDYPGYQASNTKYHDFEHTCSVVLATVRLLYGAKREGVDISHATARKCLLAALFHDTGLIQTEDDTDGTGAKYTVGHEKRSIRLMRQMLGDVLTEEDLTDIADCIFCTALSLPPNTIVFRTQGMRLMGHFLGTADLLAQIADRYYLEKLLLLFEEFQEACLSEYETPIELLAKTQSFYQDIARPRLDADFGRVKRYMRTYFSSRWGVDRDYYAESINSNIKYLDSILSECDNDMDCFLRWLRRGEFFQERSPI